MKKKGMVVLPIFSGTLLSDHSDARAFYESLHNDAKFTFYETQFWYEYQTLQDMNELGAFGDVVKKLLNEKKNKAIFLIMSGSVAETNLKDLIRKMAERYCISRYFFYQIILSSYFNQMPRGFKAIKPYSEDETYSHSLGCIRSHFNTGAPSNGCDRVVALMNRIMGMDLPGPDFPDYDFEDQKKIAWHISRENFNHVSEPPPWVIPKYPIKNGKPVFTF